MTAKQLLARFAAWRENGQPMVLASVFETAGSTYSKAGAQMLMTADGRFQGMLSGGCLEGDLAERARLVAESGEPQSVTYDLGASDEELWGLGVGCDGLMRIFLQLLDPGSGYEPFATMVRAFEGHDRQVAATVIESDHAGLLPGSGLVTVEGDVAYTDIDDEFREAVSAAAGKVLLAGQSNTEAIVFDKSRAKILFTILEPPPAVLVLGAGLDAEPVVRFAAELGWRVTVQDHRPAYVEAGNFAGADAVQCRPVRSFAEELEIDRYDAVIVMSHHLASDREYLRQLARSRIPYIGLLGPIDRRRRLLDDLEALAEKLADRLHGPAGLDLGGRGPASIALSIVAEMHAALHRPDQA